MIFITEQAFVVLASSMQEYQERMYIGILLESVYGVIYHIETPTLPEGDRPGSYWTGYSATEETETDE